MEYIFRQEWNPRVDRQNPIGIERIYARIRLLNEEESNKVEIIEQEAQGELRFLRVRYEGPIDTLLERLGSLPQGVSVNP